MFKNLQRNKWLIAMSASGIHICIGSVYAWSVLVLPIINFTQWSLFAVTITFSIAILFLGLSAGYFGKYVEKYGASKSGLTSTVFFVTGILGSALSLYVQNIYLLYLFYGILGGIGLGIGYITPISTLVKYFPNNRGFATGLAIMSFGFASMIAAPLMNYLIAQYGLITNFVIMAVFYSIIMIISSLYLDSPEYKESGDSLPPTEVYSTWQFKALWHIFFVNIACGIALLSIISPMAQEVLHFSAERAAGLVGIIGLVNGFGRIFWSTFSDYIGRNNIYLLFFIMQIFAFFFLATTINEFVFEILILAIISCYGGGFSCMPAYLADIFGGKHLSQIHGRILTAWGFAGIAGPIMITLGKQYLGSYEFILYVFCGLFVLNLIIAYILKENSKVT